MYDLGGFDVQKLNIIFEIMFTDFFLLPQFYLQSGSSSAMLPRGDIPKSVCFAQP